MKSYLGFLCVSVIPALCSCAPACISTALAQIHDPSGIRFKVARTDCDVVAKDSSVSVTASRDGDDSGAVLLKYDPWEPEDVPELRVEPGIIRIHLSRALWIYEKRLTWGPFKVEIEVDRVLYAGSG